MIRKAQTADAGRMAEIIVFNNRINYYPIFKDPQYSFRYFNVLDVAAEFAADKDFMNGCYVLDDDGIIKGFLCVRQDEIRKLYVDSFFQNLGIGRQLLDFAVHTLHCSHLFALEKNTGALRFYAGSGFLPDGQKQLEEGTTEYLLHLVRK